MEIEEYTQLFRYKSNKERGAMQKYYLAVVDGLWEASEPQEIAVRLFVEKGKPTQVVDSPHDERYASSRLAVSNFTSLAYLQDKEGNYKTLMQVEMVTDMKDQIQATASYIGFPITGDSQYNPDPSGATRPMLHSWKFQFIHPITKKPVIIEAPPPGDFVRLVNGMQQVQLPEQTPLIEEQTTEATSRQEETLYRYLPIFGNDEESLLTMIRIASNPFKTFGIVEFQDLFPAETVARSYNRANKTLQKFEQAELIKHSKNVGFKIDTFVDEVTGTQ